MVNEQKNYLSGVLRNIGFALMAPACTITFQWLVIQKGAYWGHFIYSVLVFILGVVCLVYGYIILKGK